MNLSAMNPSAIRCGICDLAFDSLTAKYQHNSTPQHQEKRGQITGKEMPPRPVIAKPDLVSEDDKLRAETFLRSFKRDYFVCPVGQDLGDFLRENNIKIMPDEEEVVAA